MGMKVKALADKAKRENLEKIIKELQAEEKQLREKGHAKLAEATAARIERFKKRLATAPGK